MSCTVRSILNKMRKEHNVIIYYGPGKREELHKSKLVINTQTLEQMNHLNNFILITDNPVVRCRANALINWVIFKVIVDRQSENT